MKWDSCQRKQAEQSVWAKKGTPFTPEGSRTKRRDLRRQGKGLASWQGLRVIQGQPRRRWDVDTGGISGSAWSWIWWDVNPSTCLGSFGGMGVQGRPEPHTQIPSCWAGSTVSCAWGTGCTGPCQNLGQDLKLLWVWNGATAELLSSPRGQKAHPNTHRAHIHLYPRRERSIMF